MARWDPNKDGKHERNEPEWIVLGLGLGLGLGVSVTPNLTTWFQSSRGFRPFQPITITCIALKHHLELVTKSLCQGNK